MRYEITTSSLTLIADEDDLRVLREKKAECLETDENFDSDDLMHDMLEHLTCNSDLQWISPAETGDMTDAPMLGISVQERILFRWAFMDYAIISVQQRLLDDGKAVFLGGKL